MDKNKIQYQEVVFKMVCEEFKVRPFEVFGKSRVHPVPDARKAFCHIIRNAANFKYTFKDIAEFINKDHSSVIACCNEAIKFLSVDKKFKATVESVKLRLQLDLIDYNAIPQY